MAVNNDKPDSPGEDLRDAHLARLLDAADRAEPPAALDAAILAAARREVSARPQSVSMGTAAGGGGLAGGPPLRAKRNWYVPVSIAAVVVMSASLVTIVHQEKGDELEQPPRTTSVPAAAPAEAQKPQQTVPETAAGSKPETALSDASPAQLKAGDARRAADAAGTASATAPVPATLPKPDAPDGYAEKLRNQNAQNASGDKERAEDRAGDKDQSGVEAARRDAQVGATMARPAPEPAMSPEIPARSGVALGSVSGGSPVGASGGPSPSAPPSLRESRPEPFPAATEQANARAKREAAPVRDRAESDASATRDVLRQAPAAAPPIINAAPAAPASPVPSAPAAAAVPRTAPAAEDGVLSRSVPPALEGRAIAPPRPAARATAPVSPSVQRNNPQATSRPAWLVELDGQPVERWLARLAEFKRDGRTAEADELMTEFRRRFPDHPASGR